MFFFTALALLFVTPVGLPHGGRFIPPETGGTIPADPTKPGSKATASRIKPYAFPGSGPHKPFETADWEFWWFFNEVPLLRVKEVFRSRVREQYVIDEGFDHRSPINAKQDATRAELTRLFLEVLEQEDAGLREAAVLSLGRTGGKLAIPHLADVYESDPDLFVRTQAVVALGILEEPAAIPVLKAIFEDGSESLEIRGFAAVAAGFSGGVQARAFFDQWLAEDSFESLDPMLAQAVAFGAGLTRDVALAPRIHALLKPSRPDDEATVAYLVSGLGDLGDAKSLDMLHEFLDHGSALVRRSAAIGLGAAGSSVDGRALDRLMHAVDEDADYMVRNFGYLALGRIGGEQAEDFLLNALEQTTRAQLPFVALGTGMSCGPDHGKRLMQRFRELNDIGGRAVLALSVGLSGYADAKEEMRDMLKEEKSPLYLGYYALALGFLKDRKATDLILEIYGKENNVELLRFLAMALALIGEPADLSKLHDFLEPSVPDRRRLATVYNLGRIGDRSALKLLKKIVEDRNENTLIRRYAVLGLGHLGDERPYPTLSRITHDHNYTIMENFLYELYNIP
jgi:HEAT repeat protein